MSGTMKLAHMDFQKLFVQGRTMLLYVVLMLAFLFSTSMLSIAFFGLLYIAVYNVAALDEQSKGENLAGALPVGRTQVVQGKYLFGLALLTAVSLLCVSAGTLVSALRGAQGPADANNAIALLFLLGSVYLSVTLPLILCLGATRARYWALGVYLVSFAAGSALLAAAGEPEGQTVTGSIEPAVPIAVGAAALLVSYLVADRLYRRKQFTD